MKKKIIICVILLLILSFSIGVMAEDINPYVVYGTGNLQTVKNAIENGAGINHQDKTGYTPIIWAATFNSHPEVIIYLLDQGADPTIKNDKGRNALDCIKANDKLINTEAYNRIVKEVTGKEVKEEPETNNVKAYRNINFGDSKKVVAQKSRDDEKIDASLFGAGDFNNVTIAGIKLHLFFYYYDEQLYKVRFTELGHPPDEFDSNVKPVIEKLSKTIETQFGTATQTTDIGILDILPGQELWTHIWELEDRRISIGMYESDSWYVPEILIEYIPLVEKEKAEANESIKDSVGDF